MLSKEQFTKIIQRLRDYNDLQDNIDKLFEECIDNRENDFCNAGSICVGHETIVVQLLENMFNDKDIISWWLWEMDYGRKVEIDDFEVGNKYIDITTPEKLYDYLVKEMENANE